MGDDATPSATLLDAVAASTAARGVCFANVHPAPRRFLPLKAPAWFTVRDRDGQAGREHCACNKHRAHASPRVTPGTALPAGIACPSCACRWPRGGPPI